MIPKFTAEVALARGRAYAGAVASAPLASTVVPQAMFEDPGNVGGRGGDDGRETALAFSCPGCRRHRCGFLGQSWCLTCCD
jgi:hypothetical protein